MDLERAMQLCADVERTTGKGSTPNDMAMALLQAMDSAPKDEEHRKALHWEFRLFSQYVVRTGQMSKHPSVEDVYPDFKYVSQEFGADADEYFRRRVEKCSVPIAEARISDFLWLRVKDFNFARRAIKAHIAAARAMLSESAESGIAVREALRRAEHLVRSLNQPSQELSETIVFVVGELCRLEKLGSLARVVEDGAVEISKLEDKPRAVLQELLRLAEQQASTGGQARLVERSLLHAAVALTSAAGDLQASAGLRRRICESFQWEAVERGSSAQ